MNMKKLLALVLAAMMLLSVLAGCGGNTNTTTTAPQNNQTQPKPGTTGTNGGNEIVVEPTPEGDFIWKTSASVISTSWNPHTYESADQSVPLDYTTSSLYTFLFNDGLHPVEGKEPYAGYVIVPEMAAELPIDITAELTAKYPQFEIPEGITEGYAYKIMLNPNACWNDGTPINAQTYVDSFERLLRPELLNYRAADYYGQTLSIAGAENYFLQGSEPQWIDDASQSLKSMVKGEDGNYYTKDGYRVAIAVNSPLSWCGGYSLKAYVDAYGEAYFGLTYWQNLVDAMDEEGLVALNDENYAWLLDVITANPAWGESEADIGNYLVYLKAYPETFDFSNVGIIAAAEYELIVVLDRSLGGFDLLYNISGLTNPLVKADLYDSLLKSEEVDGNVLWSSTYGTSAETSPSFGPYVMSSYQLDKSMHFVRNDKWWGYYDETHVYQDPVDGKYYRMYQTTEVDIQLVAEANVRKTMFFAGQLMGYGLQADDFATLRQSEYCYATPGSTIFFLILNGHMDAIKQREAAEGFDQATQDLEMLTNTTFHKAVGLVYDKDDFAATVSPARSGALGIIGDGYIYDPETGARYRDTKQAKQVLCDFYGVDVSKFESLDDAVNSITGYNPEQAKVLFRQAYAEGIEAGFITDNNNDGICDQMIRIEYVMSGNPSDFMTKTMKYLNDNMNIATAGTPFEGKIEFYLGPNVGDAWFDTLANGMSDTVLGGWSGSLLDPFGLTDLYTNPNKQYDANWYDATKVSLTINVPVNGVKTDVTMSLKQWSDCLNGTAIEIDGVTYNYGSGQADVEVRLDILAACEGKILESYNYLPMLLDGSMALLSQQVYYVVEDYNPIMGRGGLAYTRYEMNEEEWAAYVAEQGGSLTY